MKTVSFLQVGVTLATGALAGLVYGADTATPKAQTPKLEQIDSKNITAIMGRDAALSGGLKEMYPGPNYKRFWVMNWKNVETDLFTWTVDVTEAGDYAVEMIIKDETREGDPCEIELASGESKIKHVVKRQSCWDRQSPEGLLHLPAGRSTLTLRATKLPEKGKLALFSVELALPKVKSAVQQAAAALRSNTDWMTQAKYGVMFHWNARSKPRQGPPKSYADACRDFDVEAFAAMVKKTGAGFVTLTTSWADFYFPAPVKAIDELLPGRTSQRDLVGDMADALGKQGIKLILYYHPGHDDAPWWSKTGYDKEDKTEFFDLWCRVISEVGERYGAKLAGWWFDDGIVCYYPYRAPWEKMTKAAKAGNPARVVGYNAWILPKATDFQDFGCGESEFSKFVGDDFAPPGGTGRYVGGPNASLQAAITTTMESGNWCHEKLNAAIPRPKFTKEKLLGLMRTVVERRIVPMINLELYQDGTASPASVELLQAVHDELEKK